MTTRNTAIDLPRTPSLEERRARAFADVERLYLRAPSKLAELLRPDAETEATSPAEQTTTATEVQYPALV